MNSQRMIDHIERLARSSGYTEKQIDLLLTRALGESMPSALTLDALGISTIRVCEIMKQTVETDSYLKYLQAVETVMLEAAKARIIQYD